MLQKKIIAKERNKLRDIIDEAESIAETCKTAFDDLEHAADELSQYL